MPSIEANGEQIYFLDEGEGPVVFFIHSLGTNSYLFREQISEMKKFYRCVAPDCRGHGSSSYSGKFTVENAASDHKAVLDHLGIEKCHLVGLSMGGPIAVNFNARWPEVAHSISLFDTFGRIRDGAEDLIYATQEAVAYLSMLEFGSQYAGDRLLPTTPIEKLDELSEEIAKCPPKAYVDTVRAIFTYDASNDLEKVNVPTFIAIGDSDDATPLEESEYLRDKIGSPEITIIPNAGHLSTIDNPKGFTSVLTNFLAAHS